MKKILLGIVILSLLTSCSLFKPKNKTAKPADEPVAEVIAPTPVIETETAESTAPADVNSQDLANAETVASAIAPHNDPASELAIRSVYFPFDVSIVQDNDKPTIQAHGAYLGSHPELRVNVEGNADERGSSEYNLALGQRRANNTTKTLILSGASADQIETLSNGEEKPQASGHDEESWARNRRADIIYK